MDSLNSYLHPLDLNYTVRILLALFIQQVEEAGGFLANQMDTAHVVCVVNVVPGDTLRLVLLLNKAGHNVYDIKTLLDMSKNYTQKDAKKCCGIDQPQH